MALRYWRGGTGTWNTTSTTNWSTTSGGAGGASVPTAADDVIINSASGSPTITLSGALNCKSLTTTGATCTFTSTGTLTCVDNFTLSNTTTWPASGRITFSGTGTITTSGRTLACPVTINGVGATRTLGDALTIGTTQTLTLTAGTLNLNNFNLSCGLFFSSTTNARSIAFGTGSIQVNGSGVVWNMAIATGFTYTGTPTVVINNNSATSATIASHGSGGTEANVLNFNVVVGTYLFSLEPSSRVRSLSFAGFSGTWSPGGSSYTFYGSVSLSTGMTFTAGAGVWNFSSTSGTQVITTSGKSLGIITQNGPGSTVQLSSTTSLLGVYTLTIGTLDLNNSTLTCGSFSSANTNVRSIAFGTGNITTTGSGTAWNTETVTNFTYTGIPTVNISNNSATATSIRSSLATGGESNSFDFNITTGTYTLTITSNTKVRNLNFTGFTGTWSPTTANLTIYGDLTLVPGMTFTTGGTWTFAGNTTQTITSAGKIVSNITIDFSGTVLKLLDTFTQSSGRTFTISNNATLDLNSQTNTIGTFSNNFTSQRWINGTINVGSISQTGGTVNWPIANLTFNNGSYSVSGLSTFNLGSSTVTFTSFSNSGSQTINLGSGTMTLTGSLLPWTINTTGLSFNAGTSTIILDNATNSTTRTFVGGGLAYNKLVIGGGTATGQTVVITGNNTFAELSSTKTVAWTLTLPAGGTTSVGNWGITGSAGNVVAIGSSSAGTQASLSYTGAGVVTGVDYLSIQDSNAQPSVPATWYAGANSTNVSNNTGWIFTAAPVLASGNFFLMF